MGFESRINTGSAAFSQNRRDMLALVDRLRGLEQRAADLSEKRRPRFEQRGQITPRERLARLLDPGMPFLRLHSLAGYMADTKKEEKSIPGSSTIVGIGFVNGVRAMVWSDDSGIKAGAMGPKSLPTALSVQKLALRHKLPLIHLVESAGANLVEYEVDLWAHGGGVFYNLARMSAAGIPVISVLHGPSTAGGAYMPGMSDYVIGVKKNGLAALAGAALVAAATGEQANDRDLGGSEMHSTTTGLVEYLAEDDAHGVALAREVTGRLNWNKRLPAIARTAYDPPAYDTDELAGVTPVDYKTPYDVREVVARVVDGSDFSQFKPDYGVSTVCLQASITGIGVGIIGNNGPIDPQGATKAAQFIQLCDQSDTPLIFLNNTTGYMVGTEYEQAGMIKHGSKMIQAVSNVSVPKISLYIGASFGAGNYGMSGYAYEPDFLFSWPNAMTGVMGGGQAASTMEMVQRAAAKRKGEAVDEEHMKMQHMMISQHFDKQSDAFFTSGRVLDHGVIDPRDTRKVLAFCLETCLEGRARKLSPNAFGVARM
ncbi:MAG: acyl-CoA carboxylase subunit beta [Pikeienuella sp.]